MMTLDELGRKLKEHLEERIEMRRKISEILDEIKSRESEERRMRDENKNV